MAVILLTLLVIASAIGIPKIIKSAREEKARRERLAKACSIFEEYGITNSDECWGEKSGIEYRKFKGYFEYGYL